MWSGTLVMRKQPTPRPPTWLRKVTVCRFFRDARGAEEWRWWLVHTTYDNARWGSHLAPMAIGLSELVAPRRLLFLLVVRDETRLPPDCSHALGPWRFYSRREEGHTPFSRSCICFGIPIRFQIDAVPLVSKCPLHHLNRGRPIGIDASLRRTMMSAELRTNQHMPEGPRVQLGITYTRRRRQPENAYNRRDRSAPLLRA